MTAPALTTPPAGSYSIDEILETARTRLTRLDPDQVRSAMRTGAILVDIRPAAQRAEHGEIPGAIVIERNVLEWRLDPRSSARLSFATGYDLEVIVTCQEGYTSSLAAASLQDLGLFRATDLAGGFAAWAAAGLTTLGRPDHPSAGLTTERRPGYRHRGGGFDGFAPPPRRAQ